MAQCCLGFHCAAPDTERGFIQGKLRKPKNDENVPLTTYFHKALHVQKKINGEKTAVHFDDRSLSFNELSAFSTAIALELLDCINVDSRNATVGNDVIFAICLLPSEKLIPVIFGILKTGAAYLPLDPNYPEEVLLEIILRFQPKIVISDESGPMLCKYNPDKYANVCKCVSVEDLWFGMELEHSGLIGRHQRRASEFLREPVYYPIISQLALGTKDMLAVVIATTRIISDNPKGVRLSNLNIMNRISWAWNELPYAKDGTCCLSCAVSCTESISQIFGPLLKGITLHLLSKRDTKIMNVFVRVIGEKQITRISLYPTVFQHFLNECSRFPADELKNTLKHLRYVLCRGQLLGAETIAQFLNVFPNGKLIYTSYGHPELSGDILCERYQSSTDVEHKSLLGRLIVGKAISNTKIYVLDRQLKRVADGEQGQICVAGLAVAMGYIDESADIGAFEPNPFGENDPGYSRLFCTGDYGRMIKCRDGHLRLLIEGRPDELIHNKGYDFTMDDVRQALMSAIQDVKKIYIQLLHAGKHDKSVVAFAALNNIEAAPAGEIDFQLRIALPEFMIPELRLMNAFPILETNRVDSTKLLNIYEEGRDSGPVEWDRYPQITPSLQHAAQIVLDGLYKFCSIPIVVSIYALNLSANDLGCTSNNAISIFMYIVSNDYPIKLQEFLSHTSLLELFKTMTDKRSTCTELGLPHSARKSLLHIAESTDYSTQLLNKTHRKHAIDLLATACSEKGAIEKYNLVRYEEYVELLESLWPEMMNAKLSICCIRNSDKTMVGVITSHDYFTNLEQGKSKGSLKYILQFSEDIKSQFLHDIPHVINNTLECFLMGTTKLSTAMENVKITAVLFTALCKLGIDRGFANVYITTSNQLVKNMCHHMLGFFLLDDFAARTYYDKAGHKPFHLAPNTVSAATLLYNLRPISETSSLSHKLRKSSRPQDFAATCARVRKRSSIHQAASKDP